MWSFQFVHLASLRENIDECGLASLVAFTRGHQDSQPEVEGSAASARPWRSVLILVVILVSSFQWLTCWCRFLQRETRPGWSYGSPQSEHTSAHNGLDCGPSRTGLEVADVVVLVRIGPRPQPLRAVRS